MTITKTDDGIASVIFSKEHVSFKMDQCLSIQRENIHKENVFLISVSL